MFETIPEQSFVGIALRSWAPAIITIVVGGFFASIFFPRWQNLYQVSKKQAENRFQLAESIAVQFNRYITCWRRLIQISRLEEVRPLSDQERERKASFVEKRNEKRDDLCDSLRICRLHFSLDTNKIIDQYCDWDESKQICRIDELPDISEWRHWESLILDQIRKDIRHR